MRIISGIYRGKNIQTPTNFKLRPTTDFAKEALFNILTNNFSFENINVLDLFSGTGNITYEFASRGAHSIIAVESNYQHYNFISKEVKKMNFNQVKVIKADVFKFLKKCNQKFDIIFADPPYELDNYIDIYNLITENKLYNQEAILIIEHSKNLDFSDKPYFKIKRNYGSVNFSFFEFTDISI